MRRKLTLGIAAALAFAAAVLAAPANSAGANAAGVLASFEEMAANMVVVPEPASLLMLGTGLFSLSFMLRRRKP